MKENKVSMSLLYMVKGQGHLYKISCLSEWSDLLIALNTMSTGSDSLTGLKRNDRK